MKIVLITIVCFIASTSLQAQNPITVINQEIRTQLSTESGRLGAIKAIANKVTNDGKITPEDFITVINYQRDLYELVDDDFGIRQELDPRFSILYAELFSLLENKWQDMKLAGKEEEILNELEKFNRIINDVTGFGIEERTGRKLKDIDIKEFTRQYDQMVEQMNMDDILNLLSTFIN